MMTGTIAPFYSKSVPLKFSFTHIHKVLLDIPKHLFLIFTHTHTLINASGATLVSPRKVEVDLKVVSQVVAK